MRRKRVMADTVDRNTALFQDMAYELRKHGCTYLRASIDEERVEIWMEGWLERPLAEAPFQREYSKPEEEVA